VRISQELQGRVASVLHRIAKNTYLYLDCAGSQVKPYILVVIELV